MNLNATFKLFDGYSSTADKVIRKTDQATNKILNASGATDKFNRKLEATGASAGKASSGLGKFITVAGLYFGALKGMEASDTYTNTSARLDLINDGLQTQAELQAKIFAAADRSKGSYTSMAGAISKMGITASEAFGSNSELIAFTELIQKGFKVGGSSASEQSSAMLQLTQAMGAGKLQGDEFRSIMENAPMIADAIAKYTGKSKGELKQMSADGVITSEIIKNAMFMASDDINAKFAKMPYTFADVWNKIKNGATKALSSTIQKINGLINSTKFEKFTDGIIKGLDIVGSIAGTVLDKIVNIYNFVSTNWSKIRPIIEGVTAAWLAYRAALLLVEAAQWASNLAAMANPIGLAVILIAVLAGAFVMLWEKCEWFRKYWADMWEFSMKATAVAYNGIAYVFDLFAMGWNMQIDMIRMFNLALKVGMAGAVYMVGTAVKVMINSFGLLADMMGLNIKGYNAMAKVFGMETIDFDVNAKNLTAMIDYATKKGVNSIIDFGVSDKGLYDAKIDDPMFMIDLDKFGASIGDIGSKIEDFTISGWLKGLFGEASGALDGLLPDENSSSNPTVVTGLGSGGAIPVDMSDEDLQYLRDIAEREYINKFTNNALAPNVVFNISDIKETADVNVLKGTLEMMMREEIATAAEGAY